MKLVYGCLVVLIFSLMSQQSAFSGSRLEGVQIGDDHHFAFAKCAIAMANALTGEKISEEVHVEANDGPQGHNQRGLMIFITTDAKGRKLTRSLTIYSTDPAGWQYFTDQWGQSSLFTASVDSSAVLETRNTYYTPPLTVDLAPCGVAGE